MWGLLSIRVACRRGSWLTASPRLGSRERCAPRHGLRQSRQPLSRTQGEGRAPSVARISLCVPRRCGNAAGSDSLARWPRRSPVCAPTRDNVCGERSAHTQRPPTRRECAPHNQGTGRPRFRARRRLQGEIGAPVGLWGALYKGRGNRSPCRRRSASQGSLPGSLILAPRRSLHHSRTAACSDGWRLSIRVPARSQPRGSSPIPHGGLAACAREVRQRSALPARAPGGKRWTARTATGRWCRSAGSGCAASAGTRCLPSLRMVPRPGLPWLGAGACPRCLRRFPPRWSSS